MSELLPRTRDHETRNTRAQTYLLRGHEDVSESTPIVCRTTDDERDIPALAAILDKGDRVLGGKRTKKLIEEKTCG